MVQCSDLTNTSIKGEMIFTCPCTYVIMLYNFIISVVKHIPLQRDGSTNVRVNRSKPHGSAGACVIWSRPCGSAGARVTWSKYLPSSLSVDLAVPPLPLSLSTDNRLSCAPPPYRGPKSRNGCLPPAPPRTPSHLLPIPHVVADGEHASHCGFDLHVVLSIYIFNSQPHVHLLSSQPTTRVQTTEPSVT
jgi:hypothetical protein